MANIAINGFGRIGRQAFKAGWGKRGFNVVAINDLTDAKTLAHLLKYDSNYGTWDVPVSSGKGWIKVGRRKIPVYAQKDPELLPWKKHRVGLVIESTGFFRTKELASAHITAGAKRVLISATSKDDSIGTFVKGSNAQLIKKSGDNIVSNASCTTNCAAPVVAILEEAFGVKKAMLSTVHGYTATQNIVDGPHKDLRRARAAAVNMIPTTTSAAKATALTIPSLKGRFDGIAIRVPIPTVSLSDITLLLKKKVTIEEVNVAFKKAIKKSRWKGVVDVTNEPLVSSDFVGNPHSAVIDLQMTRVVGGDLIKVMAWYDNEWGYANRLVEMAIVAN